MKRSLLGAIVGGLLIFIWQMLSWTVLDLHRPAQDYSPKQDSIMAVLNGTLTEGGYMMPSVPKGASMDEMTKKAEAIDGQTVGVYPVPQIIQCRQQPDVHEHGTRCSLQQSSWYGSSAGSSENRAAQVSEIFSWPASLPASSSSSTNPTLILSGTKYSISKHTSLTH
jgi:hypothetical protein